MTSRPVTRIRFMRTSSPPTGEDERDGIGDDDDDDHKEEVEPEPEDDDDDEHIDDPQDEDEEEDDLLIESYNTRARRRVVQQRKVDQNFVVQDDDEDEEEDEDGNAIRRSSRPRRPTQFFATKKVSTADGSDDYQATSAGKEGRLRRRREEEEAARARADRLERQRKLDEQASRAARAARRQRILSGEFDEDSTTPRRLDDDDDEDEQEEQPRQYTLRERREVNYKLPEPVPVETKDSKEKRRAAKERAKRRPRPGIGLDFAGLQGPHAWNQMGGYGNHLSRRGPPFLGNGNGSDDSDDEAKIASSSRPPLGSGSVASGNMLAGGTGNGNLLDMGSGLGKVDGYQHLADTDPIGVAQDITFDAIGGLDEYINQLKEMVSLPLLYPEVFTKFHVTPPRGVLFHGPPGTGKTLVARALAASCSRQGQKISFFMRKGADCLSKWVGEAERQLRLLFEEARRCQPSIIFFDEIDGLAPVRSSKQDQIHASIVSTLLALMDGMDGRGQVIIIGATNRPDAIDPALRRPGRFDREFYFPLPNQEARKKIIEINTSKWEPPLEDQFVENLAELTKGYGGADLRALCTEAALNAIQRTYPQIYRSTERLLIDPATIQVAARDFMRSVEKVVPSSERNATSAVKPLPKQLVPLLQSSLDQCISVVKQLFPQKKQLTSLERAEFEDDTSSLSQEMMIQESEKFRINRPRMVIHGASGMGQGYLGPAVLHHLEKVHVQSFDLADLLSDSTRSAEAACVQLFVEVKRHKPSIIYIPSLSSWANIHAVSDTLRTTFKQLLDSILPTDPILLLAVLDDHFDNLPREIKSWFGYGRQGRIEVKPPTEEGRALFFDELFVMLRKRPCDYPDTLPRRKRVLEELPLAGPLPVRQPSKLELRAQKDHDDRLKELLKWRLGPIMNELKRKYKRFLRSSVDDAHLAYLEDLQKLFEGSNLVDGEEESDELRELKKKQLPQLYDIDLETMHERLYYGGYLTPQAFARDVGFILHDAEMEHEHDYDMSASGLEKVHKAREMLNHTNVMLAEAFEPAFIEECVKMAEREAQRVSTKKSVEGTNHGDHSPKGTRRTNGVQPEFGLLPNVNSLLRKRVRTQSQASSQSGERESEKRQRLTDDVTENGVLNHDGIAPVGEHDEGHASDPQREQEIDEGQFQEQTNGDTTQHVVHNEAQINSMPFDLTSTDLAEEPPAPPPEPIFHCDETTVQQVITCFVTFTRLWNVEALETLRAAAYNHIWENRSEWNRVTVTTDLMSILNDMIREVMDQRPLEERQDP